MLIRDAGHKRPVEWGSYPLEVLEKDPLVAVAEAEAAPRGSEEYATPSTPLGQVTAQYTDHFRQFCEGEVAVVRAPVGDAQRCSAEVKGAIYYLDASHAGICRVPPSAWLADKVSASHDYAAVLLVAYGRAPEADNLAYGWLDGASHEIARMRACEIAVSVAGHIRQLGFAARAHLDGDTLVDLDRLSVLAGLTQRTPVGVASAFVGNRFAIAAITTEYPMAVDTALAAQASVTSWRYWLGIGGATSGRERNRRLRRATHLSRYPMEQVKRVDRPTTLIFDDEVPRVPKRANFFARAAFGDLGSKAQQEVRRFAYKHPLTAGMMFPLRCLVPHQDGKVSAHRTNGLDDPVANSLAVRSLSYHLGADLVGICEIPDYAWYSHHLDGSEIVPYHKYAVVMLIDQGFETMEGASGDDWISGCQSMRGYIRGAEIAGIMAEFLRGQGVPARPQTNADSDVLQIPLVLLAGLGELSRIGELVLNPYVGPRFKSVVLTTDLPLAVDRPIDFGLQYFCNHCMKCARECPVNAIPFGPKVMFNGYEIWKPDVERCTSYRVTNQKGSACGRCMKTCPWNRVVSADGSLIHRLGTWLGVNARWLEPLLVPILVFLDDRLGFGKRNPIKRWWMDLEVVDGVCRTPKATNERDLDIRKRVSAEKTPVGYYPANVMPPPGSREPFKANHKNAIARAAEVETVPGAVARREAGGSTPEHYIPIRQVEGT